ncbi:MAG: hypothetical protein WC595_01345 [Candidatus Nanoarchaeia archaeon]
MFSSITFWCEFPEKVKWKEVKIPFDTEIFIASSSIKEFNELRKKIPKKLKLCVWPTLRKEEGYWFSGYCSKESILKLREFDGLPMKIDVEPPLPEMKFSALGLLKYGVSLLLFKKPKNNLFLKRTIEDLSSPLIISGLPLPNFLLKRYGDNVRKDIGRRNFFIYRTFFSGILGFVLSVYYKWFIKSRLNMYKERAMFAIGCVGPGIFGDEPFYKNLKAFEKDLRWFSESGVRNLVVFNLEGIMMRQNKEEWFKVLRAYLS